MQYLPEIFLGFFLLLFITRPFTVLFHELGHAIPAMLLTKNGATIYVGSYGDKKYSFKLSLGGLIIWFRYNPIKWHGGLCIPTATDISLNKRIIYIISGPLFSFLIATILFYVTFSLDLHGSIKLICAFALGSTVLDLFSNLIPRKIRLPDGSILHNDGYHIFNIQKLKKFPDEYANAVELYEKKEYEKTGKLFESFIDRELVNEDVYRYASTSYIFTRNYEKAHSIQKEYERKYQLNSNDFYNLGLTSIYLKLKEDIEKYFKKSIEQNPDNAYSLNGLGYYLNTQQQFLEAILLFDKAIDLQNDLAHAYNNRGHAKIEIGNHDEGLKDILHSLELDIDNSYSYRNLGIYHLIKNEKEKALQYFIQSKDMDKDTDLIEEYIHKATAIV